MRTPIKGALAAIALTGLLAGCATYDYGYGYAYDRPYYGYTYDRPYYGYGYDYGPYYYGSPYPYGPAYYYGAPSVGFDLGFRDFDRRDRYGRRDRSDRRAMDRGRGNVGAQQHTHTRPNTRPAGANRTANQQHRTGTATRHRVPPAPAAPRAQRDGDRHAAQSTMRAEQQ